MKAIAENPFRILGLSVNATERQITKRVNELSTLYEFGKTKEYNTDFPFIPNLHRSLEAIEKASSQIELPKQKLLHATFWFWNGNSADELVYEMLKDGEVDKASLLWDRQTQKNGSSNKNYSNLKNLALLNLTLALKNETPDYGRLSLATNQFMKFFSHQDYAGFCEEISGQAQVIDAVSSQKQFVDALASYFNLSTKRVDAKSIKNLVSSFNDTSIEIQNYVKGIFSEAPIHRIEQQLEIVASARKSNPRNSNETARESYAAVIDDLRFLKTILEEQDLRYQSIADNVANQLLDCSTAYFNASIAEGPAIDVIQESEKISRRAERIGCGQATKERIRSDLMQIEEIRRREPLESQITSFRKILNALPNPESIPAHVIASLPNSIQLGLDQSLPILEKIKKLVGENDETYILLSSYLAVACGSLCIKYANVTRDFGPLIPIMSQLLRLKIQPEVRSDLERNSEILESNVKEASSGCYVATWAYGSHEAPEVMVLRAFRDQILARSWVGRAFIRCYYRISPKLVQVLKNRNQVHRLVRYLLSKLVKVLA